LNVFEPSSVNIHPFQVSDYIDLSGCVRVCMCAVILLGVLVDYNNGVTQ